VRARAVDLSGTPETEYYHGDMIGTTRLMTDVSGSALARSQSVHTAFGEAISPNGNHRYGYAGAWGYQSLGPDANPVGYGAPSFLHVGHRYYDPATGRFLQRDPIGIAGALNVYEYVENAPTIGVDPTGTINTGRIRYGWSRLPGKPPGVGGMAFRWGVKGPHIRGIAGAGLFGLSCTIAAGVGTAAGLTVDHFVTKPIQESWFESDAADIGGPHSSQDPWGWVPPGSSWERQRDRWRQQNGG